MRPPAEQVIRDYLNQLSVAARNRLRPGDRSAFLARTRDYIERQSGVRDMTDPADVMRALNDYGEPEALVERERARLEARRSERERAAEASRASFWKPKPRGGVPGRGGKSDGGAASPYGHLTRKDGRPGTGETKVTSRPISSLWRHGASPKPPKTRQGRVPPPPPPPAGSRPERNGAAASGPAGPGRSGAPAGSGSTGPPADESPAAPSRVVLNGVVVEPGSGPGTGDTADSGAAAANGVPPAGTAAPPAPTRRLRRPQLPRRLQPIDVTRARGMARRAADTGRQHRAEAIAVALLALGGLIIPVPIWVVGFLLWLIGAPIAVFSEQWSLPDKVLGVVGPLALVIIGTATVVSVAGTRPTASSYADEGLTAALWLFKIGAVLGAAYLAWRLQRGRRSPQIPPWSHRHRG